MLATAYASQHFMYNRQQQPMHTTTSPVAAYSSSASSQLDHSLDYTSNWPDNGGQQRYGASVTSGFVHDLPKQINPHNVFSSSSQGPSTRNHHYYVRSERSTYDWPSPSISPHSPHTIPTPSLPPPTSGELYHDAQHFRQFGPPTINPDWNPWPENTNSAGNNVIDSVRNNNSNNTQQWNSGDLRVGPFSPPSIDNLLLTSSTTTSSPAYSVTAELPTTVQSIRGGYEMSPISSPSPSPSVIPRKLSPHSVSPPSSRRASVDGSGSSGKKCSHCNATSTPLWRREPTTLKPLCNACGLYLQQRHRHRPKELIDADQDDDESEEDDQNYNGPECSHCHTHRTSVWRRSKTGAQLCNACGVYARLRGKDRPLSLKRKKIKPRTKHASSSMSASRSP